MELLKFLIILQKIIFILIILCFIPITVVVFSPTSHSISHNAEAAYINLYDQVTSGFIIQKPSGINCSNQFLTRANEYCLQYCVLGQDCSITTLDEACLIGTEQYTLNGYKYCASSDILNKISFTSTSNYSIMSHSNLVPPLFHINGKANSDLTSYIYNGNSRECRKIIRQIGSSIREFDDMLLNKYSSSLYNQFYPFMLVFIIVFIGFLVDTCSKYNFRHYVVVGMLVVCVFQFSLGLLGIIFKITSNNFEDDLKSIATICLISDQSSTYNYLQIGSQNGVSMPFTFFLGFVCFVVLVSIAGLIAIAFFQNRAGKAKHQASSGYELQPF